MSKNKKRESQQSMNKWDGTGKLSDSIRRNFAEKILLWYAENKRPLPWRETNDPYKIWLSEIILQQTRVTQGLPYYLKFVSRFPTVFSLAKAKEQDVLALWQGLGYYSRARNLHHCAKEIVEKYHGLFPTDFIDLQKLRGIGSYTAAAIASIAFKQSVVVVDGNVFRVLARVFGIDKDTSDPRTKEFFFELGNQLISKTHPDEFNQALMEFGATHCLPKNPLCVHCIFKKQCLANAQNLQGLLPVKSKKQKIKKRYLYYFVISKGKKMAMRKRTEKDIWHGLFDFYLEEQNRSKSVESLILEKGAFKKVKVDKVSPMYKHVLSHQHLMTRFISVKASSFPVSALKGYNYYSMNEIENLPKPVLILRYLKDEGLLQ